MVKENKQFNQLAITFLILISFLLFACIPLIFKHDYYYLDDTIRGAVGQWYEIGRLISHGQLPILDISAQGSGNHIAEGQWGTFSPLTWIIGLVYYNTSNFYITTTIFKIVLMIFSGFGVFRLAKEYGATNFWSYVAGTSVMTMGFPMYASGPNWVTDLMVSSFLPWFWVSLKKLTEERSNYFIVFFLGFNLISIGYVFGTLYLVILMFGFLLKGIVRRNKTEITKVIIAGIPLALSTIAVYLPGILIAHQTMRNTDGLINNDFLSPTLDLLITGFIPNYYPDIQSWYSIDNTTYMPLMYISWILPIVSLVDWKKVKINKSKIITFTPLITLLFFSFLLTFGPSDVGPLRFPIRNIIYFGIALLTVFAVFMSRQTLTFDGVHKYIFLAWIFLGIYLGISQTPGRYKGIIVTLIFLGIGLFALAKTIKNNKLGHSVLIFIFWTTSLLGIQHLKDGVDFPRHSFSLWTGQHTKKEIKEISTKFKGDSIVYFGERSLKPVTPLGNNFYITNTPSPNIYSPVGFANFSKLIRGGEATYINEWKFVKNMMATNNGLEIPNYDLLSIDTIQFIKPSTKEFQKNIGVSKLDPPSGWEVIENNKESLIWQRKQPTPSAELTINTIDNQPASIKKTNNYEWEINGSSSKFILARMNWDGYSVSNNAKISKPTNGYLLTVERTKQDNKPILLKYEAPGYKLSIASIVSGIIIMIFSTISEMYLKYKKNNHGKK